jgi:hypothetical protein
MYLNLKLGVKTSVVDPDPKRFVSASFCRISDPDRYQF